MAPTKRHEWAPGLTVGMVIVRLVRDMQTEAFSQELVAGLDQKICTAGGTMLVSVVPDQAAELETYRRWASSERIRAVVLEDLRLDDTRLSLLEELGVDVVVSGDLELAGDLPAIWTDHAGAVRLAITALHDRGHDSIAHVAGPAHLWHSRARSAAFAEIAAELRMSLTEVQGDYSRQSGVEGTRIVLESEHPPTAIIYDNDLMALGGLTWSVESGRAVPDDVSIIAWDDSVRCQMSTPPLAALSHDVRQIGEMLGEAIIKAQDGQVIRAETPPPILVLRGSLGPGPLLSISTP